MYVETAFYRRSIPVNLTTTLYAPPPPRFSSTFRLYTARLLVFCDHPDGRDFIAAGFLFGSFTIAVCRYPKKERRRTFSLQTRDGQKMYSKKKTLFRLDFVDDCAAACIKFLIFEHKKTAVTNINNLIYY